MFFCIKCGTEFQEEALFCGKCGAKRQEKVAEAVQVSPTLEKPKVQEQVVIKEKKPISKPMLFAALALVLVVGVFFGFRAWQGAQPAYRVFIEPSYDSIGILDDGATFTLRRDEQVRVIEANGNEIFPFGQFDNILRLMGGTERFMVEQNEERSVVDRNGNTVISLAQYARVWLSSQERFIVENEAGERAMIDEFGNEIVPFGEWEFISAGWGGMFHASIIRDGMRDAILDADGNTILSFGSRESVRHGWRNNLFVVRNFSEDRTIVINRDGREVADFSQFDNVTIVSENLFVVELEEERALININGNEIIPFGRYDRIVVPFDSSPFLWVAMEEDGEVSARGIVDKSGREVLPLGRYELVNLSGNFVTFRENDKVGVFHLRG